MSQLTGLDQAISRLNQAWAGADDATQLSRDQLITVTQAIGVVQRQLDAVHVDVAAGIASESRPELGADSLAKQHGYGNPAKLIAATTGISTGDATRLIKVGQATAVRTDLIGTRLPSKYPAVREAMDAGILSAQAAALIITALERCRITAGPERTAEGERMLASSAPGLGLDEVRRLTVRVEAWLNPDGVQPKEDDQRSRRSVTFYERGGRIHFDGDFDIETGAPIVTAMRGYATAALAARHNA